MSSIVSRRPPVSGSTSHSNERRWMSIRFGRSRTLSRRAKLRRVRGTSRAGTTATPQGRWRRANWEGAARAGGAETRPANLAQADADPPSRGCQRSRTPPEPPRMWRGTLCVGGYDYRPTAAVYIVAPAHGTIGPWSAAGPSRATPFLRPVRDRESCRSAQVDQEEASGVRRHGSTHPAHDRDGHPVADGPAPVVALALDGGDRPRDRVDPR